MVESGEEDALNPRLGALRQNVVGGVLLQRISEEAAWLLQALTKRKELASIVEASARDRDSDRTKLGLFDLLCIGVGSTIGSGVFVLTGYVLPEAGPSAALSWGLAGLACLLSAVSYMELSSRLPTKGSCYVYGYHALGEYAAVVAFVCLTMEYGIAGAGIARSWSAKLATMLGSDFRRWMFWPYGGGDCYLDWCAALLAALCAAVHLAGLKFGRSVINVFTVLKVGLVAFMIIAGFLASSVDVFASPGAFFPFGVAGTIKGTSSLFFGFIGFDEVCAMASRADDPSRAVPRALAGTLLGVALLSTLAQLALVMMVPWSEGMGPTSFEEAFVLARGWYWAKWLTGVGELVLLPVVVLLSFLPQPEVMAALSEDGLLPPVFHRQTEDGVYLQGLVIAGAVLTCVALVAPFSVLWDVISLAVLCGFNISNASLVAVRYGNGGKVRQPGVAALVWALLGCTALAAYALRWGGAVGAPGSTGPSPIGLGTGISAMAASIGILLYMRLNYAMVDETADGAVFRCPGVPFTQGAAMLVNSSLMAQFRWESLAMFAALVAVSSCTYVGHKYHMRHGDAAHPAPDRSAANSGARPRRIGYAAD